MASSPKVPAKAPTQVGPTTGKGVVTKPPPEGAGPPLAANPPSTQIKKYASEANPSSPAKPAGQGGTYYGGQQQGD